MLEISQLAEGDPRSLAEAFAAIGWAAHKPMAQFERYLAEQRDGTRTVLLAWMDGEVAGYLTVLWTSAYEGLSADDIPEISDFNVLPRLRRRGIGTALMDAAEALVAERSDTVGIGVGLYPDYGPAQRLYVLRGYAPDGRGVAWRNRNAAPMDSVVVDDDLVLYFTRRLR
jgi:GNAT superfamily N-acetyltransferase